MNAFEEGLLKYLSKSDLAKIQRTKIGIIGAGGLGSNCAMLLVRSGFVQFTIADLDVVEPSNLNRQNYFLSQVGQAKAKALAENLKRINPSVKIDSLAISVTSTTLRQCFSDCDILVEAVDQAETKAMIIEEMAAEGKLLVAVSGLAGFGSSDRIQTKKITACFYLIGDGSSSVEDIAPFAPLVTLAAAKQADVVLTEVLGKPAKNRPQ